MKDKRLPLSTHRRSSLILYPSSLRLRVHLDRESLRILAVHRPAVFVMENVRGILSARLGDKPVISQILEDLQEPTVANRKSSGKRNGRGDVAYRAWWPSLRRRRR